MNKTNTLTQSDIDEARSLTLRKWLHTDEVQADIAAAVEGWISPEQFTQQVIVDLSDPALADCTEKSKFAAAQRCATLQLLPSLQQVAFIPRDVKDDEGNKLGVECTVMIQWQGFQALMLRHPDVMDVQAYLVHANDKYDYDQEKKQLINHDIDPFDEAREWRDFKDVKGGYVVVQFIDPNREDKHHFVTTETIRKAKGCALTDKIWNKWFYEQCMKTLYRNAYARRVITMDPMLQKRMEAIIKHEDKMLGNDPNRVIETTATRINEQPRERPQSRAQQLQEALKTTEPQPKTDEAEPEDNLEDAGEHIRGDAEASQEAPEDVKEKALDDPEPPKPKPLSQREKDQVARELKELIFAAKSNDELMEVSDKIAEAFAQKRITKSAQKKLVEALNSRSSQL